MENRHMSLPMLLKGVLISQKRKNEESTSQQVNWKFIINVIQQKFKYIHTYFLF